MARPSTPIIDRDKAIQLALGIIDEHGLAGLTMKKLADQFGVKDAALYYHFADKSELLDCVRRLILRDLTMPAAGVPWQESLVRTATDYRNALLEHPNAVLLMMERPGFQLFPRAYQRYSEALVAGGAPATDVLDLTNAFETLAVGSTALASTPGESADPAFSADDTKRFERLCWTLIAGFEAKFSTRTLTRRTDRPAKRKPPTR